MTLDSGAAHVQRRLARTGLDEPGGALALAIEHLVFAVLRSELRAA